MKFTLSTLLFSLFTSLLFADSTEVNVDSLSTEQIEYLLQIDSIENAMRYEYGSVSLQDGIATLDVPSGYKFLNAEQSNYVLTELWGNPPEETLGLLFPEDVSPVSDNFSYVVEITYSEEGYIDDEDAEDLDYDDLLEEMQSDAQESNEQRKELGYQTIELVGWASEPFYDSENKKLHWAKELRFSENELNTLNYNIRVLGRKGYMNLNVIGDMTALPQVKSDINIFLDNVHFTDGNTYSDFNPDLDEVAAYGIGGLIAGKLLAKAGFFVVLLKFWKIIALAVVGAFVALRKKLFS